MSACVIVALERPRSLAISSPPGISEIVSPLCNMAMKLHVSVANASARFLAEQRRRNYTTPTSYLELIRCVVAPAPLSPSRC